MGIGGVFPPHGHEGFHADAAEGLMKPESRSVPAAGQILAGYDENAHVACDCYSRDRAD